jgi:alpha-2-macroglobulin
MMRYKATLFSLLVSIFCFNAALAETSARVVTFSPQGEVKDVRQMSVRFSEQMVSFGDLRLPAPFEIRCPATGTGRWADDKNWVYDFEKDLPSGISCEFILKPDLRTLSGRQMTGQQQFSFSTGGPAIRESVPYEGSEYIDEDQAFVLTLDAEPVEESVLSHASCSIEGINERVGIRVLKGEERDKILKVNRYSQYKDMPRLVLQCRQRFPGNAKVSLIWGKGVKSLSGVATTQDQTLPFKAREPFTATFRCTKENANTNCIPLLPMRLDFSAPVSRKYAEKILLKGPGNTVYKPADSRQGDEDIVYSVSFEGPFPESSPFTIEVPEDIRDDAGRAMVNRDKFPLPVRTDAFPPLAKFPARLGIIELEGDAVLPVTLRNLEPAVRSKMLKVEDSKEYVEGLKGKMHREQLNSEEKIIGWLKKVASVERENSILKNENTGKDFLIPKPEGEKAFEVIGIPLKDPGFYVIELESRILGTSLLGAQSPMYVPTAALVTNLSAHLKWGRESSLVWVTTLDKAQPVKDASVSVRDCNGKLLWSGKTDSDGIASIDEHLPTEQELSQCSVKINYSEASNALSGMGRGLFVFARTSNDMTFVHSSWDNGIEPWRFNLPEASYQGPVSAHTIFDRTLLRAGETIHMKHVARKRTMSGFSMIEDPELPKAVLIRHRGSDQRYEFPLSWDLKDIAETTWKIPPDARLGHYEVTLLKKATENPPPNVDAGVSQGEAEGYSDPEGWMSGSFRVEEFRVPLMKAVIQPVQNILINASEADVDLSVAYLSGGGASNAPVKVRSLLQPKSIHLEDYEDFVFANGVVQEGTVRRSDFEEPEGEAVKRKPMVRTQELVLDKYGTGRVKLTRLPAVLSPQVLATELEFRDPNGQMQTASARIPLWPSKLLVGIKPDSWAASKESFEFQVAVLDLENRPAPDAPVKVELFQKKHYSHRKRLIGGFYSYEHVTEIKRIGQVCEGRTDSRGLLFCKIESPVSGNVILQAESTDDADNKATAYRDVWIAGKGEWWFDVSDNDRIDLLPEKKRYEPGETARFQVRMPFREATALVTIEREGVITAFVQKLSGKMPTIDLPVQGKYSPNVFVSALVVRGRVGDIRPTAAVDLGKPAYKLGIAEINVGWQAHELKVKVSSDQSTYKIRDKATVRIKVTRADGRSLPRGSEAAVAAVDEGLLELMQNSSWKLLDSMMGRRGYEVFNSTAQMQVVGKRHYGLKALPHGGGGGKQVTRELFDTLLFWKARVPLDENGGATVEIPLNDSLTSFRIVAVANSAADLFGSGETSIRTTQDLVLISGLPSLVREGDIFRAVFTVRNAADRKMDVEVKATIKSPADQRELGPVHASLSAGEAKEVGWEIRVPQGIANLQYTISASEKEGAAGDRLKVDQKVVEAVPVRIYQATIAQVEKSFIMNAEKPDDALAGKGGINISLRPGLSDGLSGVLRFMKDYPYTCMEQKVSRAIALRDETLWRNIISELPSHLDSDGLVKYFPFMTSGSDTLTAYILSISDEAAWRLPGDIKEQLENGLKGFIEGRVIRHSALPTADLSMRKMAALEALSRSGRAEPKMLGSISIEPNLWPTSAVIDWTNVLLRVKDIQGRDRKLKEAEQIIRARLNFQGTTMGFSTERSDYLWWLMVSPDLNSVKSILAFLSFDNWKEDMPRLVRGTLGRQHRGAWSTTTANAWGVLAMEKFSKKFEAVRVSGITSVALDEKKESVDWAKTPAGESISFEWPGAKEDLGISHIGNGKPWATVQSLAAIPMKAPISTGYKIEKTYVPAEQKKKGQWSKGDVIKVRLELEAQSDMTWVVVNDPVPGGSNILGAGLGRDSQLLTRGEEKKGWVWPAFEERSFEAFRAYYEFVPKGKWTVEYTVRLNNEGTFNLPPTRVEALYAPEMLGEIPNEKIEIKP